MYGKIEVYEDAYEAFIEDSKRLRRIREAFDNLVQLDEDTETKILPSGKSHFSPLFLVVNASSINQILNLIEES
jgi:hypothetical protein